jgi:hypothetical protein
MKTRNKILVKYTAVAMLIGFFSPTVEYKPTQLTNTGYSSMPTSITISLMNEAEARPVHRATRRTARRTSRRTVHRHSGFYRGGGYYHGGVYHPVATWTLVTLSALAIGSIISSSSMSSSCTSVVVGGIKYKQCDGTYFKPFYEGDELQYKVVASPY